MHDLQVIVERRWKSHPCNVHEARAATRAFVDHYAADLTDLIELAIGEACANAVEHGSPQGEENFFVLRCLIAVQTHLLIFEVLDEGTEFSLKENTPEKMPDLTAEGGRGLFLIRSIMDNVALEASGDGLTVRMIKAFVPAD
ncbi:MAG: histidine kinase [Capsulimonas sp.]|jgi:anti-sigma regulatory factor (Ser/Thr protein kinase)|nr:histidine kinase [Capsulimonas sp.]